MFTSSGTRSSLDSLKLFDLSWTNEISGCCVVFVR